MKYSQLKYLTVAVIMTLPHFTYANSADTQTVVRHIDMIQYNGQSNFTVHTPKGNLSVIAAPASDLAGLANLDSLSQDWVCEFTYHPEKNNYTPTNCTYIW